MVDLDDALGTLTNRKTINRKHKKYWENKKENVDLLKCFFTKNKRVPNHAFVPVRAIAFGKSKVFGRVAPFRRCCSNLSDIAIVFGIICSSILIGVLVMGGG